MKYFIALLVTVSVALVQPSRGHAEIKISSEHRSDEATRDFIFTAIPRPSQTNAATDAKFLIVDGTVDPNSGGLDKLHDGQLPRNEDQPAANFFFRPGTDGGRLVIDLGKDIPIRQVNSYSWHPGSRGPQVYTLFAATGQTAGLDSQPKRPAAPEQCGWKLLAKVDTRPRDGEPGGQYGVSVRKSDGSLGTFRYLLFDMFRTENEDPFGNTFYSEIDVIDMNAPAAPEPVAAPAAPVQPIAEVIETGGYEIRVVTTQTPDLTQWAHEKVVPMAKEWYPKLAQLLASDGFEAPKKVQIRFSPQTRGVAETGGSRISCAAEWFRNNLEGEALGAVFHELVHVVQQYGRVRRQEPGSTPRPGWLVEGMADYIRWYRFEPQSHGAEITRRNFSRAHYNGNYRITANFLNWTTETYDKELVPRLNTALREGKYTESLWKERTGHTLEELDTEWRATLEKQLGS